MHFNSTFSIIPVNTPTSRTFGDLTFSFSLYSSFVQRAPLLVLAILSFRVKFRSVLNCGMAATKNVHELIAEAVSFRMTGKKLPKAVDALVDKTFSYARANHEKR